MRREGRESNTCSRHALLVWVVREMRHGVLLSACFWVTENWNKFRKTLSWIMPCKSVALMFKFKKLHISTIDIVFPLHFRKVVTVSTFNGPLSQNGRNLEHLKNLQNCFISLSFLCCNESENRLDMWQNCLTLSGPHSKRIKFEENKIRRE